MPISSQTSVVAAREALRDLGFGDSIISPKVFREDEASQGVDSIAPSLARRGLMRAWDKTPDGPSLRLVQALSPFLDEKGWSEVLIRANLECLTPLFTQAFPLADQSARQSVLADAAWGTFMDHLRWMLAKGSFSQEELQSALVIAATRGEEEKTLLLLQAIEKPWKALGDMRKNLLAIHGLSVLDKVWSAGLAQGLVPPLPQRSVTVRTAQDLPSVVTWGRAQRLDKCVPRSRSVPKVRF